FLGAATTIAPALAALRARVGEVAFARLRAVYGSDEVRLMTDLAFRIPMVQLVEAHTLHAPAFVYRFEFRSDNPALGATHALELPFVWDGFDLAATRLFLGGDAATTRAQPLAVKMRAAWLSFICNSNPGAACGPWPAYDRARRATMILNDTTTG